jgi:hypothetical protein
MNNCSGPCLQHCYSKSKIEYILIGIAIGLAISYILNKKKIDKVKKLKSSNQ